MISPNTSSNSSSPFGELLNGSLLTSLAFKNGLAWLFPFGDKIITLGVLLFAISTIQIRNGEDKKHIKIIQSSQFGIKLGTLMSI